VVVSIVNSDEEKHQSMKGRGEISHGEKKTGRRSRGVGGKKRVTAADRGGGKDARKVAAWIGKKKAYVGKWGEGSR